MIAEHEPLKGLNSSMRHMLSKTNSSKIALSMDATKRASWYKDAINESDGDRMNSLISELASRRGGWDVGEKTAKEGGVGGSVKSKSLMPRGGCWRQTYEISWENI